MCRGGIKREAPQGEARQGGEIAHTTGKALTLTTQERTNKRASNKATNGKQINKALFKLTTKNNIFIKGAEEKREQQQNQIYKSYNEISTSEREQDGNQGSKETHATTQAATPPSLDTNGQVKRGKEILTLTQEMKDQRARLYLKVHKNINQTWDL